MKIWDADDERGPRALPNATVCRWPADGSDDSAPGQAATSSVRFGPFYSDPALQTAVNHAERAHSLLREIIEEQEAARDRDSHEERGHAEQWLSGRDSELLVFVGLHLEDWQAERIPSATAAAAIESYLNERIHEGIRVEFGREPTCCLDVGLAPTVTHVIASAEEGLAALHDLRTEESP